MTEIPSLFPRGRGTARDPRNRFESVDRIPIPEAMEPTGDPDEDLRPVVRTQIFEDNTRSMITENDSPDVGMRFTANPYRGCEHGCVYCYARPFHEYLGLSAGLDFETKIFAKKQAPEILRRELSSKRWQPAPVSFSGVTDAYQPVERELQITRRCLEVMAEFKNPFGIVTKNALVTRDLDILAPMATLNAAAVFFTVTTLDPVLSRKLEPRASSPGARLSAMKTLSDAGVPVGVLVSPIIPGLTDTEVPQILAAAAGAGAKYTGYVVVRLPHAVKDLFLEWLHEHYPQRKAKVVARIRELRGGKLYDATPGDRMRGTGPLAEPLHQMFELFAKRYGLRERKLVLSTDAFVRPSSENPASPTQPELW